MTDISPCGLRVVRTVIWTSWPKSVLVAPSEGAKVAAPGGATLPTVDVSEWGTKRAGEASPNISLDSDAHFGNHENTSDDLRSSKTVAQLPYPIHQRKEADPRRVIHNAYSIHLGGVTDLVPSPAPKSLKSGNQEIEGRFLCPR